MLVTKTTNDKNLITEMALNGEPVACEALFDLLAVQWRHLAKMKHAYTVLCFEDVESIARCTMFEALAAFAKNGNSPLFAKFAGYFGTAFKNALGGAMSAEVDFRTNTNLSGCDLLGNITDTGDQFEAIKSALTKRQWQAVYLVHIEGLTQEKAALTLGISQPALNKLLDKAKERLKDGI